MSSEKKNDSFTEIQRLSFEYADKETSSDSMKDLMDRVICDGDTGKQIFFEEGCVRGYQAGYAAAQQQITQARREVTEKVMRLINEFHAQQAGGRDYSQGLIDGQQALAVYIKNGLTDDYLKELEQHEK